MRTPAIAGASAAALITLLIGCQPDSITGARSQLGRGPIDTVEISIPLLVDTVGIGQLLPEEDTVTTPNGSIGVRIDSQSLNVDVADELGFANVEFESFSFGYDQLLETQEVTTTLNTGSLPSFPSGPAAAPPVLAGPAAAPPFDADTIRFTTPNGAAVTGADIASGWIVRIIANNTNCDATTAVSLTDATGDTIASFPSRPSLAGSTDTDSVSVAGATIADYVSPDASLQLTSCPGPPAGTFGATFVFRPLSLSSVSLTNIDETFTGGYAALDSRFDPLDTLAVDTGSLDLVIGNRTPLALTVDLTVSGVSVGGAPLQRRILIGAAPGDGSTLQRTVPLDLAGATIVPQDVFANVTARAIAASATITAAVVSDAASIDAAGSLEVDYLVGVLDPEVTPELVQFIETEDIIEPGSVDFDEYEDAVRGATINDAPFDLSIVNGLDASLRLDTFNVGIAQVDATGGAIRDLAGNVLFETDSNGVPILVTLAEDGQQLLDVPRASTTSLTRPAAALVDRLVHLLLDDERVALVGSGTVRVGDGQQSRVNASDSVSLGVDLIVGMDLTLPDSGLVLDVTRSMEAAGLDADDAAEIAARLIEGRGIADIENGMPLEASVEIALIAGNFGDSTDVFTLPGHIELDPVILPAATVDPATGRTTDPTLATLETALTGQQALELLGDSATATVRVRVRPPAGSGGRAAIQAGDGVTIRLRARLRALIGGGS